MLLDVLFTIYVFNAQETYDIIRPVPIADSPKICLPARVQHMAPACSLMGLWSGLNALM